MFDRKMVYARDLAIIAEGKQELQETLDERKEMVQKQGMRMGLEKTEEMWVGQNREELNKGMALCTLVEWLQKTRDLSIL